MLHLVAKYVRELAFWVIAMAGDDDGPPLSLQLSAFHCVPHIPYLASGVNECWDGYRRDVVYSDCNGLL